MPGQVYDIKKHDIVETYKGHTDSITGLALSPDGWVPRSTCPPSLGLCDMYMETKASCDNLNVAPTDVLLPCIPRKCSKFLLSNSMDKTARIWDIKPFVSGDRNIKTFQGATVSHQRARLFSICRSTSFYHGIEGMQANLDR